jgi:hypothetical protein
MSGIVSRDGTLQQTAQVPQLQPGPNQVSLYSLIYFCHSHLCIQVLGIDLDSIKKAYTRKGFSLKHFTKPALVELCKLVLTSDSSSPETMRSTSSRQDLTVQEKIVPLAQITDNSVCTFLLSVFLVL